MISEVKTQMRETVFALNSCRLELNGLGFYVCRVYLSLSIQALVIFTYRSAIYADSGLRTLQGQPPAQTLVDDPETYRTNRDYPALQELAAGTSFITVWDDHEVVNDDNGQTVNPQQTQRIKRFWKPQRCAKCGELSKTPAGSLLRAFRVLKGVICGTYGAMAA